MNVNHRESDPGRREVVIAVNPHAGSTATAEAADRLAEQLAQLDYEVSIRTDLDEIDGLARERFGRLRCVVAAGGDGTIGLLVNRLPARTPFALLPQGTENLLAKFLQIPFPPEQVARIIDAGTTIRMDAGRANGRLFLVMASCGFDAEVVHQVHRSRTGHIRHWAYAKPIINSIRKYRYPTLSVRCDNEAEPIRMKWAFVFNAPRYAMGLPIADGADAMDGKLDLCGFRGGNLINGLMYLAGIVTRQHRRWRDTVMRQVTRICVEADEPVPFQIDGDPGGHLPLDIRVVPQRVHMIVPRAWAETCPSPELELGNTEIQLT